MDRGLSSRGFAARRLSDPAKDEALGARITYAQMGTARPVRDDLSVLAVFIRIRTREERLHTQADRLAWLRAWSKAGPLFAVAERAFAARGDERHAMYARMSALRGQIPRLPAPDDGSPTIGWKWKDAGPRPQS